VTKLLPRRNFVINGRFLTQPTTGVQRVARELTKAIDRLIGERNYPVSFRLICERHADLSTLPLANIEVEYLDGPHGASWEQFALPRALGDAELICLGNTAPLWSLATNRAVTVMIHDLSYQLYPNAYSRAYRLAHRMILPLILSRARCILTVSETERAQLVKSSPKIASRIVMAQNGGWSDALTVRNAPDLPPPFGQGYLLYVGSLSQRKNVSGLLKAATRLARERGLRFLFVGSSGPVLTEPDMDVPLDVAPLIQFAGQVEDLDLLAQIYRNARCLVFPSFYEASPLPPLEAMQFGCPVVGSDIPSMRERCGDAIEYCDPTDVDDIVRAVLQVVDHPELTASLREKGFARAVKFSWHAQAQRVLAALIGETAQVDHTA
jgi:glycosyltransferase involved in cell wall biosynthesis